ncbi:DNA-binding protein [Pseudomonas sp. J452]|uniref:DNA-binding protein n=1 Tax=Pseudomonas sp. J452 TaxID=2898441 RepID=UPI0021AD792F|nr:DNA-binding protein [Pseudomonas sp. J452]UUY10478.1 DNA-binding protein [Pseudomonas sp. J452]
MEQSGVVGLSFEGNPERVTDFRDAPLCSQQVLVDMFGTDLITPDVVRGWVESYTLPTVKVGRRRVINLHRIRRDLDRGKTVFCAGDYADE